MSEPVGPSFLDLHPARPCVYLDQWVWVRLAKASKGEPKEPSDLQVLAAVQDAAADGVAFPLSATHHIETSKIPKLRWRRDLARTMASISYCRTLREQKILLRHQMLHAMHVTVGRPAFRPEAPDVLGTGVRWAFVGEPGRLVLRGPDGVVDLGTIGGMPGSLRKANQLTELMVLAGPSDAEAGYLREHYGYRPEVITEIVANRLSWETSYVDVLAAHPASKTELRVRLQARELLREHLDLFQNLTSEYRISLTRDLGINPDRPKLSRQRLAAFLDAIPSLRIAVDLKVELFRGAAKPWSMNAVHDIDALSMAVPYCHVVVPDREMASLLARSHTAERHGTVIIAGLTDLPDALRGLAEQARNAPGDRTGWDWAGPWDGYCLDWSDLLGSAPSPPAA
ncbi:hypothetical protein I6A60_08560 [Frankia sp. AgB1.9]|uniref:hypothetical protein n=1 Tax=unclassified Frankia TaxID=2632575 RepID=UPI00193159AB|nr:MULTISPECIES: hypothetical protein [unclassified Frankia]MBL7487178.1 hypothetical protein [Frankia sp. AgW1.1]MBL7547923.1 hypothetical protein [Frankia sp. AgB1.9]MBL7623953.1 hypothetical protein [Frankia sp. AgB1.8]